jgi:hypothetical protein
LSDLRAELLEGGGIGAIHVLVRAKRHEECQIVVALKLSIRITPNRKVKESLKRNRKE